ncbi:hypothetical protein ENSA5_16750 [Enhygromyxa salina]|uniref:TPM domain-containing protein n=1 Tax=Enhygromyxa salina TaxID=215803 RepID=A0A2S9YE17_9BACT|nr:TPM domain-containing protein [Enhygromyxa salina]PRQ03367.1 hypothetical protein ENSA5_16750 [Enhygromyxa salina]
MPRWARGLLGALLGVLIWLGVGQLGAGALAYQPPAPRGHVNDLAKVLDPGEAQSLEAELSQVRRDHGYDLAVLILPSLDGEPIEDVAYDTFNTWGVGDASRDDGVLLVLAVAEQRVRIETGEGVGGELTDLESGRIIREQIKPLVVAGRWYEATSVGTRAITETLTGTAGPRGPPTARADEAVELTLFQQIALGLILVVVIVLAIIFPGFRRVLFWVVLVLLRSGGRGGGGGRSGGGMGGGGSSGGGGASG